MKTRKWIAFLLPVLICLALLSQAQWAQARQIYSPAACVAGPHSGEITANETWCVADNPHILTARVVVNPGITLTIEPGVTVQGAVNTELKTLGHLSAIGTEEQQILFTSTADTGPIEWGGLSFDGGTGDLQYVTVRYGGDDGNSVARGNIALNQVTTGAVNIQNSTISDVGYSFYLNRVSCLWVINSHVTVNNTTFTGCATAGGQYGQNYPIYISGAASMAELKDNIFTNNYKDRIALEPGAMMGQDATLWPQTTNGAYELLGSDPSMIPTNFTVPAGITLTVQAGVTVMGNQGRELLVQGRLDALGEPTRPVTFTSVSNTAPGQWAGIVFNRSTGILRNTIVRYAAEYNSSGWKAGLTVNNVQTGQVVLENSTITGNGSGDYLSVNYGMVVNNSRVQVTSSQFTDNGNVGGSAYGRNYPLYIFGADSAVTLTGNTFTGNSRNKIGLAPGTFSSAASTTLGAQTLSDGYELDGSYTISNTHTLILQPGVTLSGRTAQDELLVLGRLEAVGTVEQPITFTSGSNSAWEQWPGVIFNGGTGHLSYVNARFGGVKSSMNTYGTINAIDVPANGLLIENSRITNGFNYGLHISNSPVTVINTRFEDNGANPRDGQAAIYTAQNNTQLTLTGCVFEGNARDLLMYGGSATLTNNAFLGGWSDWYSGENHAIVVNNGASAMLLHNTIANLKASGVYVASGGLADLTNSIFAQNGCGVTVEEGGTASLDHTLWDRNGANISGAASEIGSISGPAGFTSDGYHLTRYSMAIERGVEAGVSQDIDAEGRPLPSGTAPDLGADEYIYTLGEDFAAELFSFDPQWVILPNPATGNPTGMLRQGYFMRYFYGNPEANSPALTVNVTNTLPDQLAFESQQTSPAMSFSAQGQVLNWQSQQPLEKDETGEIIFSGLYDQPVLGDVLTNNATLSAGNMNFSLQASTEVPLFPPLITFPGSGEICRDPSGNTTLNGTAQAGAIIRIYENGGQVITTTVGSDGIFSVSYALARVGTDPETTITAKACAPSDPTNCSKDNQVLKLTPAKSFWCPQRSSWSSTRSLNPVTNHFRNAEGLFSSLDWQIPGDFSFGSNTVLKLYACNCPGTVIPPTHLSVVADGVTYYPSGSHPNYTFNITGQAHTVVFSAHCGAVESSSPGVVLIDPDGYVFDVMEGFDPISPTLHAVEGVTVTAYVSMTEWGGWVPWPAHLYDNQVNPQVTGDSGYFAFFTPPGSYYLQVDGSEDYQSWRSPIIEVVNEIVHVNVPLTPESASRTYYITLTDEGPDQAEISIPVGSTVVWHSELSGVLPLNEIMQFMLNPVMRLLSALNPESNTNGWDSGMLAPGQNYSRRFLTPGVYTYSDGDGHTGQITVEPYKVFLPFAQR